MHTTKPISLRKLFELAVRGRAFKRNIRIGSRQAKIYVTGDAQLKYLKPGTSSFDQDLINISLTCLEESDVVWDIGANIGVFSIAAATVARSVVAFEADIWLAELLRRSCRLPENRKLDIQVLPAAASQDLGIAKFLIAERGRASNALASAGGRSQMGGVREETLVPTIDLDTACRDLGVPDMLKIDVEGAEEMVIAGGKDLFKTSQPLIYVEVSKASFGSLCEILRPLGYQAYTDDATPITEPDKVPSNVFFACDKHTERLNRLRTRLAKRA